MICEWKTLNEKFWMKNNICAAISLWKFADNLSHPVDTSVCSKMGVSWLADSSVVLGLGGQGIR